MFGAALAWDLLKNSTTFGLLTVLPWYQVAHRTTHLGLLAIMLTCEHLYTINIMLNIASLNSFSANLYCTLYSQYICVCEQLTRSSEHCSL